MLKIVSDLIVIVFKILYNHEKFCWQVDMWGWCPYEFVCVSVIIKQDALSLVLFNCLYWIEEQKIHVLGSKDHITHIMITYQCLFWSLPPSLWCFLLPSLPLHQLVYHSLQWQYLHAFCHSQQSLFFLKYAIIFFKNLIFFIFFWHTSFFSVHTINVGRQVLWILLFLRYIITKCKDRKKWHTKVDIKSFQSNW